MAIVVERRTETVNVSFGIFDLPIGPWCLSSQLSCCSFGNSCGILRHTRKCRSTFYAGKGALPPRREAHDGVGALGSLVLHFVISVTNGRSRTLHSLQRRGGRAIKRSSRSEKART